MTLDTGRLSCGFDSGTVSEGTLNMRMLCTDFEEDQPSMYGAQLKLRLARRSNSSSSRWTNSDPRLGRTSATASRSILPSCQSCCSGGQ